MSQDRKGSPLTETRIPAKWTRRGNIAVVGFIVLAAIAFLGFSVAEDLEELETARSDNLQWHLAQTEVEFLAFATSLSTANPGAPEDLSELRQRFDVFYSRVATIETAAAYRPLMEVPDFQSALTEIRSFLDDTVSFVDADDAAFQSALPKIAGQIDSTRADVRQVATSALHFFTVRAGERRADFAQTLIKLAVAVALLIAALGTTIFYLRRLNIQRTQRQREVEETAARMDTVIQTSLDGVIVANEAGNILAFNTAAETIFGHMAEDVLGKSLGPLIVPDHMLDAHEAGMERMRQGGEKRVVGKGRVKLEAKHSDGSHFPVELAIQTAETNEGTIFVAFLRDISASVAAEKELISARDQALAADRLKTEFLATMSHEIRTPLNGLLGNLTLLQDTHLNANQRRYIRNMDTSGALLLKHVTDVLDLSRYDVGRLDLRSEPVNLADLIQSIVDSQSGLATSNNTSIEWRWIGEPSNWVKSDPDALQHMLINLVSNAVKFTHDGKVSISVEARTTHDTSADVVFQVHDTGVGMDDDLREKIFDDFVTGTVAYDRDVGGTGLGLGIVRRSVDALGGTIAVESTPGKGSRFEVCVPLTLTNQPQHDPTMQHTSEPLGGLHILVVEDNEINRAVVREMLRADGHMIEEVANGKEAVELAAEAPFDLILMDISMPVMDGQTATRAIRQGNGACAMTPIIALTANAMASEQAAFLEDGMNSVLIKPLSRSALRKEINEIAMKSIQAEALQQQHSPGNEMREVLGDDAYDAMRARFIAEVGDLHGWLGATSLPPLSEVAQRCHKTAGSAGTFGTDGYRAALIAVEDAAKAGDEQEVMTRISALDEVWQRARHII